MSILQSYLAGKTSGQIARGEIPNPMMAMYAPQMAGPVVAGPFSVPGESYGGGAAGGSAGNPSEVGQRLMGDLMRDFGLTEAQAAGVVGNLDHESGGFKSLQEIEPLVEGSRGGYGYAQWTGPRRRAFEAWAAENGLDPASYEANYGFLRHELTATPEGAVIDKLRGAQDPATAATIFSKTFLRPGIPHMDSRVARAGKYYNPMASAAGV